ncbi:MAG: GEVED domain-containing protein, partial [Bacteroidia bacterium]|nr:GEVED domain-containing protein [Bacteroidia bacterium]
MKTKITFRLIPAIMLLSLTMQVFSQTTPDYYNRLFYLCKAWGHAKYFHTQIAKGLVNWDDKLLAALPAVKNATTDAEFSAVVLQMLNSAGIMGTSTAALPDIPNDLNLNPDRSWIDNPVFSEAVRLILKDIQQKFRPQTNVYVGRAGAGNPDFDNDNQYYTSSNYPDEGLRLLALFRYWNMYHYFYPYKYLMDQPWDATLVEFIPRMLLAANEIEFHLGLKELTTRVNDTHAIFSSPVYNSWKGGYYPPFLVRFIGNETVITKVLPGTANVSAGDVVREIDGKDIYQLRNDLRKYGYGSNNPAIEGSLNALILAGNAGTSQITVFNGTTTHTESFTRDNLNYSNLQVNDSPVWKTTPKDGCTFGIVDMARLEVADVPTMFSALWNTNAIIFDIRNYPKGTLWTLVNYLFPGPIHIADFTTPDNTYPGRLFWKSVSIGTGTSNPYKGKVILLFDDRTISQAEYTCMGLSLFPDAIKIGSQTLGADGNVSYIYLPGNGYAYMTGLGTFYPDRTPTQRIGIVPDYVVHPTIEGIRAEKDELMEFALNCALLNTHPDYCTSAGNATNEWIASVTLGSNSKSSGSSLTIGYQDFISAEFKVEAGKTYTISLKPGFVQSRFENWAVWIDYNGDKGFDEPGELVFSKNKSKTTVSGSILIPSGLSLTTRMRVTMSSTAITGPCDLYTAGEVEDYTLIISTPAPPPLVSDFAASPLIVNVGQSVQFIDLSTGTPTGWSWSFPGGNPATSTLQNPPIVYNVAGTYDVILTVTRTGASNTVTKTGYIKVNDIIVLPYCVPATISSSLDYIKTVAITGVITNITAGTGYTVYQVPVAFTLGKTYPVTLTPNNSTYRNYWKIWIDFNKDGDFLDTGESVLTATNKKGAFSSSIAIPSGSSGSTRMRISMRSGATPQPCDNSFTGEVEDYDIILGSAGFTGDGGSHQADMMLDLSNNLKIYPNPVSHELTIQVDEISDQNKFCIYTREGKLL